MCQTSAQINFIHTAVQASFVGDTTEKCWLALYADANAGDLKDSRSTGGCVLVLVGPDTFAPLCWCRKKQGAVSHFASEAEIRSLYAATRIEGIPALLLWEEVTEVLAGGNCKPKKRNP